MKRTRELLSGAGRVLSSPLRLLRRIPVRVLILLGAAAIVALATILATHRRPPAEATLAAASLTPGRPTALVGVATAEGDPSRAAAPFEADLGALEIADLGPSRRSGFVAGHGAFALSITVALPGCRPLVSRLGGSCGRRPLPASHRLENLAVQTLASARPFMARVYPGGADRIEITNTTTPADPRPASAWWLREDAPRTGLELHCPRPTRLLIVAPPIRLTSTCAPHGATYRLLLSPLRPYPATVFLSDVAHLEAHLAGRGVDVGLSRGNLSVDGGGSAPLDRPTAVALNAAGGTPLHLGLEDPSGGPRLWVSGEAASVTVDGEQRVGTWLERNSTAFYAFLAALITLVVPPLYLLGRRA